MFCPLLRFWNYGWHLEQREGHRVRQVQFCICARACVCVCVCSTCCCRVQGCWVFVVVAVVTRGYKSSRESYGGSIWFANEGKKKHTHTSAHLQRHRCVCPPRGMIRSWIGALHRLTSEFLTKRFQEKTKRVCTKDMPFTSVAPFYQYEPAKAPLVTASVALLKFNQVLFALTFQSMPSVHIAFKVASC